MHANLHAYLSAMYIQKYYIQNLSLSQFAFDQCVLHANGIRTSIYTHVPPTNPQRDFVWPRLFVGVCM